MQLVLAIVQDEDADVLLDHFGEQGFRATRINTMGSFLVRGNATILLGVEDAQVEKVIATVRRTCRTRRVFMNPMPPVAEPTHISMVTPLEVEIGGATIFSLPVRRTVRLQGGEPQFASDSGKAPVADTPKEGGTVDLMISIVQNEDASPVTQGLLDAGYRVTRINTAGGFLRRGNATLLIGVEEEKEEDVLQIIQANCRPRSEENPPGTGMPAYSATVFVLDASRFVRI